MTLPVSREIERFAALTKTPPSHLAFERVCEHGVRVSPKAGGAPLPSGKTIGLTLMGLTHGNEWAGAAILNETLAHLVAGHLTLPMPVAFILGNPWAAEANKRFLERDLNRCFARASAVAKEERRAKEIAPVLAKTAYLVDFHQTSRASDRAFFIFPYAPASFAFARLIAPRLTVVTHWGKPFSAEGMCTDEYVNSQGGVGVSLEVGQNGLDPYQIAVGVDAALWAIARTGAMLSGKNPVAEPTQDQELYTWGEIVPWPEGGVVDLETGWTNFGDVALGQRLGTVGGAPIVAKTAGKMLFPKYLSAEQQAALESRPTELCRIMKRITPADLPR